MSLSTLQNQRTNLRYLLNVVKDEIKRELNCHAIGTIITFDPLTATANVAFNYKKVVEKGNATSPNTYTDVIIDYPVLVRCPVIVMGGGGGYTTYPIFSGDQCLLMFCDRDIDLWLEQGSKNSAPNSSRMHDISDAVALVGLNPVTKPISWVMDGIVTVIGQTIMKFTSMLASLKDSTGEKLQQSGFGQVHFGIALPSGWLWCNGAAVSRTLYPTLFNAIGTTYGAGDGITTFNLPDMRGRNAVGLDNIGGSDAARLAGSGSITNTFTANRKTLGGAVGECMHTQTLLELVPHTHLTWYAHNNAPGSESPDGGSNCNRPDALTVSAGGGLPFNVVQPGLICNWIIKI